MNQFLEVAAVEEAVEELTYEDGIAYATAQAKLASLESDFETFIAVSSAITPDMPEATLEGYAIALDTNVATLKKQFEPTVDNASTELSYIWTAVLFGPIGVLIKWIHNTLTDKKREIEKSDINTKVSKIQSYTKSKVDLKEAEKAGYDKKDISKLEEDSVYTDMVKDYLEKQKKGFALTKMSKEEMVYINIKGEKETSLMSDFKGSKLDGKLLDDEAFTSKFLITRLGDAEDDIAKLESKAKKAPKEDEEEIKNEIAYIKAVFNESSTVLRLVDRLYSNSKRYNKMVEFVEKAK